MDRDVGSPSSTDFGQHLKSVMPGMLMSRDNIQVCSMGFCDPCQSIPADKCEGKGRSDWASRSRRNCWTEKRLDMGCVTTRTKSSCLTRCRLEKMLFLVGR